ncbi:MAG: TonB family protein [Candidatus Sulfotelmatobacter sp.]
MVRPIWQVLTDLGIEGEYCHSAVDAVEKVTTQLFQIVITDWEDQPEATFLLKTARDLKAAQRPLTLAIVSDDSKLPEALQAGANSVLVRPIRPEQVRDTMSTACELLRAKQSPPRPAESAGQPAVKEAAAMAAAAAAGAASVSGQAPASAPAPVFAPVTPEPEKTFRAGEFLQSPSTAPGAQFVTECEIQKSITEASAPEVDALTELEPMAASVESAPAEPANPRKALDGWASLQARLTRPSVPAANGPSPAEAPRQNEFLGLGEMAGFGLQGAPSSESGEAPKKESRREAESEAALFSYIEGEAKEDADSAVRPGPRRSKAILVSALAVACVVLAAMPRTRRSLLTIYRNSTHAGRNWLNPPPVPVPAAVTQHETFEQDSNEYKLPVAANIPDATTDASQIRVLPVVDPTAKPSKGADAVSGQDVTGESASTVQGQNAGQNAPVENEQTQGVESQVKEPNASSPGDVAMAAPGGAPTVVQAQENAPVVQQAAPQPPPRPIAIPVQNSPQHVVPAGTDAAIPSSLRSQTASSTPEASGAMPVEAAMSSIEPVNLPEPAAWGLLTQPVDPVYPDAAKASGQRGSVVLQVLIGRDGAVQDAKFLQGSLVFARAAIDAVKQWRFKPYTLNGRTVSVKSLITLNFKPPA